MPMIDENQLILMIKIPLLDTDSTMTLYKTYNLPIFHPDIGKSLAMNWKVQIWPLLRIEIMSQFSLNLNSLNALWPKVTFAA